MVDVVIAGAGPAAWSLAAELAVQSGSEVTIVAPEPLAPWPNRYGAFADELDDLGLSACANRIWSSTQVALDSGVLDLARAYARIDAARLQAHFVRLADGRVRLVDGVATALGPTGLETSDGRVVEGDIVVDARGARPKEGAAAQVAWGIEVEVDRHPFDPDVATLMDFRTDAWPDQLADPTFLYALPFGPNRLFVEETSLAARPPHHLVDLQDRLTRRLAHRGVAVRAILATERCFIRLDVPPPTDEVIVPFGAAAGFVHPATGYSIVETLRAAPRVARAVALGDPADAIAAAWPEPRRRAHDLYTFGRDVLCDLDARSLQDFLATFFAAGRPGWTGFLGRTASPAELAQTMAAVFARLEAPTRVRVGRRLVGHTGFRALRALL